MDSLVPRLATEVPTLENGGISPDGLTYRFHIRDGVEFANGYQLTPEDVEYSIKRVMVYDAPYGPAWMLLRFLTGYSSTRDWDGSAIPEALDAIDQSVEVDGDYVVLHLATPYAPSMSILALTPCSIVSKQWCIENGDWPGTRATMPDYYNHWPTPFDTWEWEDSVSMGTGPFVLGSCTEEEKVLARNDAYWRGPAQLETVIVKSIHDWETRKQMFLDGDVDICHVFATEYTELEGVEGIRVHTGLLRLVVDGLNFNFEIAGTSPFIGSGLLGEDGIPTDFFANPDIRKGFAYAFDYDGFIDSFFQGEAIRPATPVMEGLPFYNPEQEKYTTDLAQAELHFRNAGVWDSGFRFTLVYNEGNFLKQDLAEFLKTTIESINPRFHLDVIGIPWPEYWNAWSSGQLPLKLFASWGADYPDPDNLVYPYMYSSGYYPPFQGYSDPVVDSLIEDGWHETDPVLREAIYYELQRIYHDDAPGIILAQTIARHYERTWVRGWYHNPITRMDFYTISKELYTFGGILQPVNSDGSSIFKQGRTIPFKFQLFDDAGLPMSTAHATIDVVKISDNVAGEVEEDLYAFEADVGNEFRYDAQDEQYIFNLRTKILDEGTYVARISLDDGQVIEIQFSLR
jgi:peptide/nickel transport system substrate-binding protein